MTTHTDEAGGFRCISVVIPAYNEQESIGPLAKRLAEVLFRLDLRQYEVIFVDDGSTDGTWAAISEAQKSQAWIRGVRLRRNFGKAAALDQAIRRARFDVVVTMDADLQDEPSELPKLLAKLAEGYDVVSGWKKDRKDPLGKRLPSLLFNWITARVTGLSLRDFNCGFKAYRREVFYTVSLYGELHRFIPALAHGQGFRVGEVPVVHNPRVYGKSKYGLERFARGLLDLLTVVAINRYASRPGHLFGSIGLVLGVISAIALFYLGITWFFEPIGGRPLLLVSLVLALISLQFLFFGLLAELHLHRAGDSSPHLVSDEVGQSRAVEAPSNREKP